MKTTPSISFLTLLLMISFASVNAVLFTPALPNIADFFHITDSTAQQTILWFLIGYALGQLIYGPLSSYFGRKKALYLGIGLQIISSLICVLAGLLHEYLLLITGRFLMAVGAGVGLKMCFTLVNENYEPKIASQKMAYLMLSFAITPGLSIALGGILNAHFGWMSCFYVGAFYGVILFWMITRLPTLQETLDPKAFELSHLIHGYATPFKSTKLVLGGFVMGGATSFIYVFSALAPFVAMNILGMNSTQYGAANILPAVGLALGSIISAKLTKHRSLQFTMGVGMLISAIGVIAMFILTMLHYSALISLFIPMFIIYCGLSLVFANVSTLAMNQVQDKAHGSAVMNFINIGMATIVVFTAGWFAINSLLLPIIFISLIAIMGLIFVRFK